jgi:signal transduction histidine kinase
VGNDALLSMSKAVSHEEDGVSRPVPACHWSFNRKRRFHYICGDTAALFHRAPEELLHSNVSTVDDSGGNWAARLDRLFSGDVPFEQWTVPVADGSYTIVHVPVHANDGALMYVAGFVYRDGQPIPAPPELRLAALAALEVLGTERKRTARFLHDVAAQCLSTTGLQLELLRLEIEARNIEVPGFAREIQRGLDEALRQIRAFSAETDPA